MAYGKVYSVEEAVIRENHRNWWVLLAAFALTVFEGAIRKWVIGSAFQFSSYLVYFSKDIVFAFLLLFPVRGASSVAQETFGRWLIPGCFLLICGGLSSITQEINLAGTMLTIRALLFLPVVAFMVAPRLRGMSLRSVALLLGLLTILNFALGVMQNHLLPQDVLNRYATDTPDISTTETGVRATGTFSYITGMGIISLVGVWAGIVYVSLGVNLRQQTLGWAVLACGFGCGLASVSRGPVLIGSIMILTWLLFSGAWASTKPRSVIAGILLLAILASVELTTTFFKLGQGLLLRAQTSSDTTHERGVGQFEEAVMALEMAPFGNGLGTEQIGRYHYSQREMANTTFESQWGRLILETGAFGLAGYLIMGAGAILALQVAKRYTTASGEIAALLATQLLFVAMFSTNLVFNHVASAFTWMIFAAVLATCGSRPQPRTRAVVPMPERESADCAVI
jgi:hypothetical protein